MKANPEKEITSLEGFVGERAIIWLQHPLAFLSYYILGGVEGQANIH